MNTEMPRTEQDFRDAVRYGKEWEWTVYGFLKTRFPAIRPPKTVEQALSMPRGQVDEAPDMSLYGLPIECKRRRFGFTGAADYPYTSFYIDEEYKLRDRSVPADQYWAMSAMEKRAHIKPFMAYLTCNSDMTYMGVVIPASKTYWTLDRKTLTLDDRRGDSWACQLNKVLWVPVAEWRSILTWI